MRRSTRQELSAMQELGKKHKVAIPWWQTADEECEERLTVFRTRTVGQRLSYYCLEQWLSISLKIITVNSLCSPACTMQRRTILSAFLVVSNCHTVIRLATREAFYHSVVAAISSRPAISLPEMLTHVGQLSMDIAQREDKSLCHAEVSLHWVKFI